MSIAEEETFEEYLERHNKIIEAIRNPNPTINQQIQPQGLSSYQHDPTYGFVDPVNVHGNLLVPNDGFNNRGRDQSLDEAKIVNQTHEPSGPTSYHQAQTHDSLIPLVEHNGYPVPDAEPDGMDQYGSSNGDNFALQKVATGTTGRAQGFESPIGQQAKTSKRAERLANLERQIGPERGLGANGLPKGVVRSPAPGMTEWWSEDFNAWIPAVFHESLRPGLLAQALSLGRYEHPHAKGRDQFDQTSFLPDQKYWAPDRENGWYQIRDHVLFRFQRGKYPIPHGEVGLWYHQGHIVLDTDNNPVKKYSNIPACCSSEMEGWLMEAISRLDGRISQSDFRARMPSTRITSSGAVKPLYALTALGMRMSRFREQYSCPAWNLRTGGEKIKMWFWNRMSPEDREAGMTYGLTKLTELELAELRALNKGKFPERAGSNALTSEERERRDAEAVKKLELKYGEKATEVLAGTKRKRLENVPSAFSDGQPAGSRKRIKAGDYFPTTEESQENLLDPEAEGHIPPYHSVHDVGDSKRKRADALEISAWEEPAESSKRQKKVSYSPTSHSSRGRQITNSDIERYRPQSSSNRPHEQAYASRRSPHPSKQSSLQHPSNHSRTGLNKGKRTAESVQRIYGTAPTERKPQYQTRNRPSDPYTVEVHASNSHTSSQCEPYHSTQLPPKLNQYYHRANGPTSLYAKAPNTEQPVPKIEDRFDESYDLNNDKTKLPVPSYSESYASPKREAPLSKRKREEIIEESDSEEDQSFLSAPKRVKPTPSEMLSSRLNKPQSFHCKRPVSLKIRSRLSGGFDVLDSVKLPSQRVSHAGLQNIRNFGEGKLSNSPIIISDELEETNERPVSTSALPFNQSQSSTALDHPIHNAELLPSGAVDFRYVQPVYEDEQKMISLALEYTRSEYIGFLGEDPPQTSSEDSYATQHANIQAALAARWTGPKPVPGLMFLKAWGTTFADFPLPDVESSQDQSAELSKICDEAAQGVSNPANQMDEVKLRSSNDLQRPVDDNEIDELDSLFADDTLVADPEDEQNLEEARDQKSDHSLPSTTNEQDLNISNDSRLPLVDEMIDELDSLFGDDTLVADPEDEPSLDEGQDETSDTTPQAAAGNQNDSLDSLFGDDTLVENPEDEQSIEGQDGNSNAQPQAVSTGLVDDPVSAFPGLDDLTTQFTYEELMGVELLPLTEEQLSAMNPL